MDQNKSWSLGFEFLDIEIIDHKNENQEAGRKWNCDQCRLFFLSKEKLSEHKKKHLSLTEEVVRCKYCNKVLSAAEGSKDCYSNGKCETCEYRCSRCPQRFLRRSSLINHEKNHVLLNKKKKKIALGNKRKIKKIQPANGLNVKNLRKKRRAKTVTEIVEHHSSVKGNVQSNPIGISPKKKRKLQSEKLVADTSVTLNSSEKISNRSSVKSSKPKEVDTPVNNMKNKANNVTPTSTPPARPITPASENVVNYKPFSCHVCGDNFASDNALLQHIESHGGNAAKVFRCKHCGDEFGDIYKMQYHLAICPLAEDELESALKLKQAIPRGMKIKMSNQKSAPGVSNGTPLVRKRGRPRKYPIVNSDQTNESTDKDFTPSPSTRSGIRKRKLEEFPSSVNASHKMSSSPISKRAKRRTDEHDPDDFGNEYSTDCVEEDVGDLETNPNENSDEKKVHSCPFPRCGIKFSREKALLCHMRNHNDDFEDVLKCHKCDIPFDDLQSLRTHIDVCKGIKEEKDDDFDEPTHGENDNSSEKSFQRSRGSFMCKICGRTYATKDKLNRHLELHRSSNFKCRICKDVFLTQLLLDKHFAIKHPAKSPYHCSICKEDFISLLFLQIHESDYHKKVAGRGKSSGKCSLKNVSVEEDHEENMFPKNRLYRMRVLKRHSYSSTVSHTNISKPKKQFFCPICAERFRNIEYMRMHIRKNHVSETDSLYVCEVCEVRKQTADMLCFHLEVHSNNLLSVNKFSLLRSFARRIERSRINSTLTRESMRIKSEQINNGEEGKADLEQNSCINQKDKEKDNNLELTPTRFREGNKRILLNSKKSLPSHNKDDLPSHSKDNISHTQNKVKTKQAQLAQYSKETKNLKELMKCIPDRQSISSNISNNSSEKKVIIIKKTNKNQRTSTEETSQKSDERKKKENLNVQKPFYNIRRRPAKDINYEENSSEDEQNDSDNETSRNDETSDYCNKKIISKHPSKENRLYLRTEVNANLGITENKTQLDEDGHLSESPDVSSTDHHESTSDLIDNGAVIESQLQEKTADDRTGAQTDDSSFTSSDSETDEEICCTMCSLSFYNQDELLDHVATHI